MMTSPVMGNSRRRRGCVHPLQSMIGGLLYVPTCIYHLVLKRKLEEAMNEQRSKVHGEMKDPTRVTISPVSFDVATRRDDEMCMKILESNLYQKTFGCLEEFSYYASGRAQINVLEDFKLVSRLRNTSLCHGLVAGDAKSDVAWTFEFPFAGKTNHLGQYHDVKELKILKNKELIIIDRHNNTHRQGNHTWNLAKAHTQAQLTLYGATVIHARSHSPIQRRLTSLFNRILPEASILRRLFHIDEILTHKHRCYICSSDPTECETTSNSQKKPWAIFSSMNQEEAFKDWKFPPLKTSLNDKLTYQYFLKEYYKIFEEFVKSLLPFIKEDYVKIVEAAIGSEQEILKSHSCIDVVTNLLFNQRVMYSADNYTFVKDFALNYGCFSCRKPLVLGHNNKSVEVDEEAGTKSEPQPMRSSKTSSVQFRKSDVFRTRCFFRVHNFFWDARQTDNNATSKLIEFESTDDNVNSILEKFHEELLSCDRYLSQRSESFVPLTNFGPTLCF